MAITMCCVASLFAQGSMNAYNYSRTDIKGTARYMGMGGAFGALGGDISSIVSKIRREVLFSQRQVSSLLLVSSYVLLNE